MSKGAKKRLMDTEVFQKDGKKGRLQNGNGNGKKHEGVKTNFEKPCTRLKTGAIPVRNVAKEMKNEFDKLLSSKQKKCYEGQSKKVGRKEAKNSKSKVDKNSTTETDKSNNNAIVHTVGVSPYHDRMNMHEHP